MTRVASFESGTGGTGVLVPPEPTVRSRRRGLRSSGPPRPPDHGDDGRGGGGGDGGHGRPGDDDRSPDVSRFALGLAMAGISTFFTVFLAVWLLYWRGTPGASPDDAFVPPATLWISTAILIVSSMTVARSARLAGEKRGLVGESAAGWLLVSLLLGVAFLASQALLWWSLVERGYVPSSGGYMATFFALTGLHGLHVAGGLVYMGLAYRGWGSARPWIRRAESIRLSAAYWHFMGVVWVVVFGVLTFSR